MNQSFWGKMGFATILAGILLDYWLAGMQLLIWFGLCFSFFCFIDIDNERKRLKNKIDEYENPGNKT